MYNLAYNFLPFFFFFSGTLYSQKCPVVTSGKSSSNFSRGSFNFTEQHRATVPAQQLYRPFHHFARRELFLFNHFHESVTSLAFYGHVLVH